MKKYGLIGYPLSHSFSPDFFAKKFKKENILDTSYEIYPIEDISMVQRFPEEGFSGFNVTIPYKESVIPYLDEIDDDALAIGAVNTVIITDGKMKGYNTDVYGFRYSLEKILGESQVKKALILGTGGAAKAVQYVLNKMDIKVSYVSRKLEFLGYSQIDKEIIEDHQLIVNTTPLGMYPNVDNAPELPYEYLNEKHFLIDLIYNPKKTLFLINGERQGATILNGMKMLILQAEKSWSIWNQ